MSQLRMQAQHSGATHSSNKVLMDPFLTSDIKDVSLWNGWMDGWNGCIENWIDK